jgi:hypothetical protein
VRHYDAAGGSEVRRRLELLFDCVLESIAAGDLSSIVGHARQIAEERFRSGYDLSEVHAAFSALEAAIWARVLLLLPPDRFARMLGLVTTVLGAGRDALAQTYVSLATDDRAPSLDLRALFAGAAA